MDTNRIITGDCFEELEALPKSSIHACVTDPPYGLAFMGRDWDDFEPKEYQEWCEKWAREVKRVLKPGGHLLAFSGNRTHHRLFSGVQDAGFEIRDTLTWHYGSGFPKASDIGKTIDKRNGAEREQKPNPLAGKQTGQSGTAALNDKAAHTHIAPEPATPEAEKWDGWKTGLKPATEFVCMARKPFENATVDCVLKHGTGALNIDGTRVESGERPNRESFEKTSSDKYGEGIDGCYADGTTTEGRYPSNVVFDEREAERLDEQVGELSGGAHTTTSDERNIYSDGDAPSSPDERIQLESGGPSRYFYTSKASKAERTEDGQIENSHPTVKPQDLMEWLVKLVTREGQIVLDPFCGSGTALKACKELNREFIGIEKQTKWADVARVRVGLTPNDPSVVRESDNQQGLEQYD